MRVMVSCLIVLALGLAPWTAAAQCSISVQSILFGDFDPSSAAPTRTIAQFTLFCIQPTSVTISLGASQVTGKVGDRQMRHDFRDATLAYNLYQDPSATIVWGDGAGAPPLQAHVEATYVGRIYGEIYPQPDAWVGDYSDTILLTVLP